MLKYLKEKIPALAPSAKADDPGPFSSTGSVTPADTAPSSSNSDRLTSALNSLRPLLIPSDQEIQRSLASGTPAESPALTPTDERRLLESIFPSLDGRIWDRNQERAEGRGETLRQQCEEAIQFYFDNHVGYS